jgi:hypothetical protein
MRIGFLALSGIRACDPELLALGLTLPVSSNAAKWWPRCRAWGC